MKVIIHNTSEDKGTSIYRFDESENKTINSLFEYYKLDKNYTYLVSNGKTLKEDEPLNNFNNMIIETRIRLKGGKGGFGNSLKIQQAVKKQTKNFDACRDLQGRRLRKVNQERQLNEWRLKKAEEEKLLQKYIEGYNNPEEDLFKKIINEKRQYDALIKYDFKKKKKRKHKKKEKNEKQKYDEFDEEKKGKKILKLKKIKNIGILNDIKEDEMEKIEIKLKEKEDIEKIKKMDNEEDLFNAILA